MSSRLRDVSGVVESPSNVSAETEDPSTPHIHSTTFVMKSIYVFIGIKILHILSRYTILLMVHLFLSKCNVYPRGLVSW